MFVLLAGCHSRRMVVSAFSHPTKTTTTTTTGWFVPGHTTVTTTSPRRSSYGIRTFSSAIESPPANNSQEKEEFSKLPDMDEIVSLCKRRGIIFPSSDIYNGYAGFYDYGPLGAELKKNIKDAWWRHFVTQREDVVGLDSSIIHNPTTWKSSGTFLCSFS